MSIMAMVVMVMMVVIMMLGSVVMKFEDLLRERLLCTCLCLWSGDNEDVGDNDDDGEDNVDDDIDDDTSQGRRKKKFDRSAASLSGVFGHPALPAVTRD